MAGKQSWAETRWWHGTVFAWPAVLLGVAFAIGFAAVALPSLLVRHTMSRGLQDYYLTVYRSTCESSDRRTAALPYVTQLNGGGYHRIIPFCHTRTRSRSLKSKVMIVEKNAAMMTSAA